MLRRLAVPLLLSLLTSACSAPPPKSEAKKEPEKPVEPVTGRFAFQQTYLTARNWAADAQGLRVRSIRLPQVADVPGKAGAWEVVFVSPSRSKARTITYSTIEAGGNLHEGVFANIEENWSGPRPASQPWIIAALKSDSDTAYQAAAKKSAEYLKKNPDKPVNYLLEMTDRHPYLTWRVIWGDSLSTSDYSIYVNASTGVYIETMR